MASDVAQQYSCRQYQQTHKHWTDGCSWTDVLNRGYPVAYRWSYVGWMFLRVWNRLCRWGEHTLKKIQLPVLASGTNVQTVNVGGSRSGADPALSENGSDVVGCPREHAIRRCGFVFLSHVLQLRFLHDACHGSIAARPSQLHYVIS